MLSSAVDAVYRRFLTRWDVQEEVLNCDSVQSSCGVGRRQWALIIIDAYRRGQCCLLRVCVGESATEPELEAFLSCKGLGGWTIKT